MVVLAVILVKKRIRMESMENGNKPKVIVIVGPTASGKTKTSIEVAKKLGGEIVSADSMQIYKEMNIGTAKPSLEEQSGIKHYMIDVAMPEEEFNVAKYKVMAEEAMKQILVNGKIPILVGGTGLYVNTLVDAIEFMDVPRLPDYSNALLKKAELYGAHALHEELRSIDAEAAEKIDENNVRRVIRALEIYKATGKTKTELDRNSKKEAKYDYRMYGIDIERDILYNRINKRVDMMLEDGLIKEVEELNQKYRLSKTALQGLGYKEVLSYLHGEVSYEEMVLTLKMETRRYAKRQLTWFRRDKRIQWYPLENIANEIITQNKV